MTISMYIHMYVHIFSFLINLKNLNILPILDSDFHLLLFATIDKKRYFFPYVIHKSKCYNCMYFKNRFAVEVYVLNNVLER